MPLVMPLVMGLDGSMTAFGWGVLELGEAPDLDVPVDIGCIRTEKESGPRHVYMADDDGRRLDEIVDGLLVPIRAHRPKLFVIEAPAGAQHAASAKALGLSYGLSRTLARVLGVPVITVQAEEPRRLLLGKRNASKLEIEQWCLTRWPACERMLRPRASKPEREGAFDALSVAVTGARSVMGEAIRMRRSA